MLPCVWGQKSEATQPAPLRQFLLMFGEDDLGGGGVEKISWYRRTAYFSGGIPGGGGGRYKEKVRAKFFLDPIPEICSTLPHLFGFGRCKEDSFQGNH